MKPEKIVLINPFDAHMHWRQGDMLSQVAHFSMAQFAGGLVMPNTTPKITDLKNLMWYQSEVQRGIWNSPKVEFLSIFTYYLSADLPLDDLEVTADGKRMFHAVKYYPKGGTTGSDAGLKGFKEVAHILEKMQKLGIPLLIHGETPDMDGNVIDDFEREQIFMETELTALVREFPALNIVLEHITTKAAADFVIAHDNMRATITPQHCMFDRRALFNGSTFSEGSRTWKYDLSKNGMYPSMMCRPILKHKDDLDGVRGALIMQAKNGLKKFGLGTDTAPHTSDKKYCECGACGVFSAPIALELYAMAFEHMGILDHLPVFACDVMPEFYGIKDELPKRTIVLEPQDLEVLPHYNKIVTPFAGQKIPWKAHELIE